MGCCQSTNNVSNPTKDPCFSNSGGCSKSPPPSHPLLEEETVKEVLSETPSVPKSQPNHQYPLIKAAAPVLPHFGKTPDDKTHPNAAGIKTPPLTNDEPSEELSEICSTLSESVSVTENREANGDGNDDFPQIRQKSPAKFKNRASSGEVKRDKTVGRSPGRRPDPSPQRVRNGPSSGSSWRTRDGGESSGRRSRSPVTRSDSDPMKTGMSRSHSTRRTGKSPGRVGPGSRERVRKVDEGKEAKDKWPPTSDESLENPLVSLECFIFL